MATCRQLVLSCTGILALSSGMFAQKPTRPAVRMLPAQPMEPLPAITARAAAGSAFDPLAKPAAPSSTNDGPRIRNLFEQAKDPVEDKSNDPSAWKKFTKWVDDKSTAVKKKFDTPPAQPQPRVGQGSAVPNTPPSNTANGIGSNIRKFFEDTPAVPNAPKDPAKVNAATPAYRWYGYGSATPGINAFAPTGDYPSASSQWYVQSGATPGAFPVPTMNPMRPAPGAEPPMYYATTPQPQAMPPSLGVAVPPPTQQPHVVAVPSRRTIAETPAMTMPQLPKQAPPMPSMISPSNQIPQVPQVPTTTSQAIPKMIPAPIAEPAWKPVSATEPAKPSMPTPAPDPNWKPADQTNVIIPVIRGAGPDFDDSPLSKQIQDACRGLVVNVIIRETGPRQLTVSFKTTTATLAEIAARAVSNLPELKPYSVEFQASVTK
ncbi:hypothetical protein BH11PLA2_BH11PLA2_36120 [soil metagenome]